MPSAVRSRTEHVNKRRHDPETAQLGEAVQDSRRDQILSIAARRFAEFGFEATKIREIAKDANILSGSIYHHFSTKEEMLDDIIRKSSASMAERAKMISSSADGPEENLATLISAMFDDIFSDHDAYAIIYNERKFFRKSGQFSYVADARQELFRAWKKTIRDGVHLGIFRSDLNQFLLITSVVRMINTYAEWYRHEEDFVTQGFIPTSSQEVVAFHLDMVLRMVRKSP